MCLIKGAFVGKKNFERYQNARYNNKNLLRHVYRSAIGGFSWNLIYEDFSKICRENSSLIKILEEKGYFT
jgi:hypothetical protein